MCLHCTEEQLEGRVSKAWNMFVQLGMTDDSYIMENSETMSYRDFVNAFLPPYRFC
jgi:hypothetical protein